MEEREAAVERLREFLRFNYITGNQIARRIGVRDMMLYSWLQGKGRPTPAAAARISAFIDSLPAERAGIMPTGYESREYKNWRGIPKPAGSVSQPKSHRICLFWPKNETGDFEIPSLK